MDLRLDHDDFRAELFGRFARLFRRRDTRPRGTTTPNFLSSSFP
jgi:hypothetical protein